MLAEPGCPSSWEIRGFSRSPGPVGGSEPQLEESRGQASSSQDGGEGEGGCYTLLASREVMWLLPPNPSSPLLPLLPCLRLYQPWLSLAPAPGIPPFLLWVMHLIWRSVYVRRFAELHTLLFVLADLLHRRRVL